MSGYAIWAVAVSAVCTLLMRALPFLLLRRNRPGPRWLDRLGKTLPAAIMAVLVVYCLRDGLQNPAGAGAAQAVGVALVVASYGWKRNTFVSILLGTAGYMAALRLLG